MALASAQEDQEADRGIYGYGSYDYYGGGYSSGYYGKSQTSQSGNVLDNGNLVNKSQTQGIVGNGRVCWQCNEKSYSECLAADASNAANADPVRHGAVYCQGEEYFCYIHERRIIRHDGNDYNFEKGAPWSSNSETTYQEENNVSNRSNSNKSKNTQIRVQMGCQQPQACLRQMHQNYKIEIGKSWFNVAAASNPLVTLPVYHNQLGREGLCRLGDDWQDYASGHISPASADFWRKHEWRNSPDESNPLSGTDGDRRYGAVEHHYHYGKGTESVCHYCCDALLEYVDPDTSGLSPYDFYGCNYYAADTAAEISASATINGVHLADSNNLATNLFINRQQNFKSPVWYHGDQYHGMFRNPHTQYPRSPLLSTITASTTVPNARR